MTEHFNPARGVNEWADTYGALGTAVATQLTQLPLGILDPWVDTAGKTQPFKPYSQDKLEELAESIRKNGVIEAICVRPMPGGRFQIIAGHNRVEAAKMAGLTTIPAIIRQISDDEAAISMVDSNLQHREKLLYSEKAWAYRVRLEAMKRLPGRPKNNCGPMGHNFDTAKSRDEVAEIYGESGRQIQRYIRLTYLLQSLLELVDNGKFAFQAAVEISYLDDNTQALLLSVMNTEPCKAPSLNQAKQLRALFEAEELDEEALLAVMVKPKGEPDSVKLPLARFGRFFPKHATPDMMIATIEAALEAYTESDIRKEQHNGQTEMERTDMDILVHDA